jgi:hypothetical protein
LNELNFLRSPGDNRFIHNKISVGCPTGPCLTTVQYAMADLREFSGLQDCGLPYLDLPHSRSTRKLSGESGNVMDAN